MRRRRPDRAEPSEPPRGSARLAALRLLARREYTTAELTDRLTRRGFPADDVAAAVTALERDGTVDDRRAALAHVRTASGVKGRGAHRIRRELEARGIAAAIVADALATLSDDDARQAIERFLRRRAIPRPVPAPRRRTVFQQLLRRGFPATTIAEVLRTPIPDDDDEG